MNKNLMIKNVNSFLSVLESPATTNSKEDLYNLVFETNGKILDDSKEKLLGYHVSNIFQQDEVICALQVWEHYYSPINKKHLYVTGKENKILKGFYLGSSIDSLIYVEEPEENWFSLRCADNLTFPQTMEDIFREWGSSYIRRNEYAR